MNKAELVKSISDKTNVTQKDVESIVNTFMDVVKDALCDGDKVQLVGFGTFEVADRAERTGKNPQTGEPMTIAACKAPKFKAGKAFKEVVNK